MGVFAGIRFLCRAGPMCPAAGYAFFSGAHGPRPTGCGGHTGRTESSAPTKQNKNRAKRDVEDAVPYGMTGNGAMWASPPTKSRGVRAGRGGERWGKMFTLAALTLGNYYCIIN